MYDGGCHKKETVFLLLEFIGGTPQTVSQSKGTTSLGKLREQKIPVSGRCRDLGERGVEYLAASAFFAFSNFSW
jgi:hypothetical protein